MLASTSEEAEAAVAAAVQNLTVEGATAAGHIFFEKLREALSPTREDGTIKPWVCQQTVQFVIRGAANGSRQSWTLRFGSSSETPGEILGEVQEGVDSSISPAATTHFEARSFQDILDLASRRVSPLTLLARRRISVSGDLTSLRQLAPVLSNVAPKVMAELPSMQPPQPLQIPSSRSGLGALPSRCDTFSSVASCRWIPNEESDTCMLCNRRWTLVTRRRHHCRRCGILVCSGCSLKRSSIARLRICLSCLSSSSPTLPGVPSDSGSAASTSRDNSSTMEENSSCAPSSPRHPKHSVFQEIKSPLSAQSGWPTDDSAETMPPAGSEQVGVLATSLNQYIGKHVASPIYAERPTEREQHMWEQLVATGKPKFEENHRAELVTRILRIACLAVVLCLVECSSNELRDVFGSTLLSALSWLRSPFTESCALLVFFTVAISLVVSTPTRSMLMLAPVVARFQGAGQNGSYPDKGTFITPFLLTFVPLWIPGKATYAGLDPPWVFDVANSYPRWCVFYVFMSIFIVRSLRNPKIFRYISIYFTAFVPICIYQSCKILKRILRLSEDQATELLYDPADHLVAPFLARRCASLGGLFVKMCQWFSGVSHAIPIAWVDHLKKLQDTSACDTREHVRRILHAEFGRPVSELFAEFDFTPLASASIAQVHSATIRETGQRVAVKIQHEDIEEIVRSDLRNMVRILRFIVWLGGDGFREVEVAVLGWVREVIHEVDFEREVANLREIRAGLTCRGAGVVVPSVIDGWVSRRAFAMEFCEGFSFSNANQLTFYGVDRTALAARVVHAIACQLLEIGLFSSDPHPGNLLCQVRGNSAIPVLLDFGNSVRLPDKQRLAYCKLMLAVSEWSVTGVHAALDDLGLVSNQADAHPERDLEYMLILMRDTGNRVQQREGFRQFRKLRKAQEEADFMALGAVTKKEQKNAWKKAIRFPTHFPEEILLFLRTTVLLRGVCATLNAQLPYLKIFEMHARRALVSLCPVELRARTFLSVSQAAANEADGLTVDLARRVRCLIARICADRPTVGVQVCAYMGHTRILDECGGVLGAVDPRPMNRDTPIPLADLSHLICALLLVEEVRLGRTSYDAPVSRLFSTVGCASSTCSQVQLTHALTHCALDVHGSSKTTPETDSVGCRCTSSDPQCTSSASDSRNGVDGCEASQPISSSTGLDLRNKRLMGQRVILSLRSTASASAEYWPWGVGIITEAAICQARGGEAHAITKALDELSAANRSLLAPEASPQEGKVLLGSPADCEEHLRSATLSSAFASSLNGIAGRIRPINANGSSLHPGAGGQAPLSADSSDPKLPSASKVASVLESGLLIDVGLATLAGWTSHYSSGYSRTPNGTDQSSQPQRPCLDLGLHASARAVAAALARSAPTATPMPQGACTTTKNSSTSDTFGFAAFGQQRRAYDTRGFQMFSIQQGSSNESPLSKAALGGAAAGGLLGLALQWPAKVTKGKQEPITIVVLATELNLKAIPSQVVTEICSALDLPVPLGLT